MRIVSGQTNASVSCSSQVLQRRCLRAPGFSPRQRVPFLQRSRRNLVCRAEEDGTFSTKDLQKFTEEQIQIVKSNLEESRKELSNQERRLKDEKNFVLQALIRQGVNAGRYLQNNQERWLSTLNSLNDVLKSYPPDGDGMDAIGKIFADPPESMANATEITNTYLVMRAFGSVMGASIFCWSAQTFFGALPYDLWHAPEANGLATWATWTLPFVGMTLLAAKASSANLNLGLTVRPLATADEKADQEGFVNGSVVGIALYSVAMSWAAGVVHRGVWLNSITDKFVGGPAGTAADPNLMELTLRSSMGSLVPTSAVPIPAVLLLAAAIGSTALGETVYRLLNSLVATASLETTPSGTTDVEPMDGSLKGSATASIVLDDECVAPRFFLQLLVCLYLATETLVTDSLLASVATQSVGFMACVYYIKASNASSTKDGSGSK